MTKSKCPFCDAETKFSHTWFSDVGDKECEAWIDYAKGNNGELLWYAVLNGDQYTKGHSLVILASHRRKITDCSLMESELSRLAGGVKKVSSRLKDILGVETVHILSLCEGIEHLHFHLIPRHRYTDEEKKFYIDNYWDREKDCLAENGKKKWETKADFEEAIMNDEVSIHGIWYAAYHEMKFKTSPFGQLSPNDRVKALEDRAACLCAPNLKNPFIS